MCGKESLCLAVRKGQESIVVPHHCWVLHSLCNFTTEPQQCFVSVSNAVRLSFIDLTHIYPHKDTHTCSRKEPSPLFLHLLLTTSRRTCTALARDRSLSLKKQPHPATISSGPRLNSSLCLRDRQASRNCLFPSPNSPSPSTLAQRELKTINSAVVKHWCNIPLTFA